jgi:hypothetical protein
LKPYLTIIELLALSELPTAYDYIHGHPLSCILEWVIANVNNLKPQNVISFSSKTIPVLAVLRKNSLENRNTQIIYTGELPEFFDAEIVKNIYGYHFELKKLIRYKLSQYLVVVLFLFRNKRTLVL